jgi:hypothetical protein
VVGRPKLCNNIEPGGGNTQNIQHPIVNTANEVRIHDKLNEEQIFDTKKAVLSHSAPFPVEKSQVNASTSITNTEVAQPETKPLSDYERMIAMLKNPTRYEISSSDSDSEERKPVETVKAATVTPAVSVPRQSQPTTSVTWKNNNVKEPDKNQRRSSFGIAKTENDSDSDFFK